MTFRRLLALVLTTTVASRNVVIRRAAGGDPANGTDSAALEKQCLADTEALRAHIQTCKNQLSAQSSKHEATIAQKVADQAAAEKVVNASMDVIKQKQDELDKLEAENKQLHADLIKKLGQLRPTAQSFAVQEILGLKVNDTTRWKEVWQCRQTKASLELELNQCTAKVNAQTARQDLRESSRKEMSDSTSAKVDILKQRKEMLDKQLELAKKRKMRLLEHLRKLADLSKGVAQPSLLAKGHVVRSSKVAAKPTLSVPAALAMHSSGAATNTPSEAELRDARQALSDAKAAHSKAVQTHKAALERHAKLKAVAEQKAKEAEVVRAQSQKLQDHLTKVRDVLSKERVEAKVAEDSASESKGQANALSKQLADLSKDSREAFKKAFLLDNKRKQAQQAYEDAVTEAKIATENWEQQKQRENEARYNVSNAESKTMEMGMKVMDVLKAAEHAKVEEATAHQQARKAESDVKAAEMDVTAAERVLRDAGAGMASQKKSWLGEKLSWMWR